MKNRWLSIVGGVGVLIVLIIGLTSFPYNSNDNFQNLQVPFIVIGELLSIAVVGLGEILYHLKSNKQDYRIYTSSRPEGGKDKERSEHEKT